MVVEGDGRAWHTRVEDFERDRRRDQEAAAAGLLTLRFTWFQLTQEPDWVREVVITAGQKRQAA
jgi:very-short-patch-repair endonuclease